MKNKERVLDKQKSVSRFNSRTWFFNTTQGCTRANLQVIRQINSSPHGGENGIKHYNSSGGRGQGGIRSRIVEVHSH